IITNTSVLEAMMVHADKLDLLLGDARHGGTALHFAARFDYDHAATILMGNYKTCPNQPCNNGYYPIHVAARNASIKVLGVLLRWAADRGCQANKMINTLDSEGNTPLHSAVHGGEIKAVQLCLEKGAKISMQQQDRSTPVHLACSQGAIDLIKLMFSLQPEEKAKALSTKDAQNMTPLHCAAMFDHPELVTYLIEEGAYVNALDIEHRTPLLLAAAHRGWRSVEALLSKGADPCIRDIKAKNILHIVIVNGGSIAELLSLKKYQYGLDCMSELLNEQDSIGCSPMHYASRSGQIRAIASLLQFGASVRTKNNHNESPLHFAAKYGRYNTVRQLLESVNGFLILNEMDGEGKTALHISCEEGHTRVVSLLLSKGAVLIRDHEGCTPLHLAAHSGHVDTIAQLLSVHSHILDQRNKDGNTAIHVATKSNKPAVVTQLLGMNCKVIENNLLQLPIDIAIQHKIHEAAIALVTHERGPEEIVQRMSKVTGCVCSALIQTLPKVYERALDQAITKADCKQDSDEFFTEYNFYPIQISKERLAEEKAKLPDMPGSGPPPLYACNAMVQSGRVDLLMHPVTQKYLEMKWQAYGMYVQIFILFIYLLYLSFVTMFTAGLLGYGSSVHILFTIINDHPEVNHQVKSNQFIFQITRGTAWHCISIAIFVFSIAGIFKEFFHIYHHGIKYLSDAFNAVEWALYLSSICMVIPVLCGTEWRNQQFNSAAVAVFSAWVTLLIYLQRFDSIGIYIVMFLEILNTLLKVLAVFSILIIAFGLSFYVLLSHIINFWFITKGHHLGFTDVSMSIMRTFSMMLGEVDFLNSFVYPFYGVGIRGSILYFPKTTFAMLIIFMILMPILLMNLLIGLAVGDIESVKRMLSLKELPCR
ncbi:unnamed protein product, partial [Meganyctiphanes norvegica]